MKKHNMEQRSDEWFAMRDLKMTASNAQKIGNMGKGLESYVNELVANHFTSGGAPKYSNEHIERGINHEKYAILAYEMATGNKVDEVGFIEHNEYSGCSPDGLVGEDGGVEVKCLNNVKHMKHFLLGHKAIESQYVWQIQMCIFATRRKWWDYISYNMDFTQPLYIYRVFPDETKQEAIKKGLEKGEQMIKDQVEKLKQSLSIHD